MFVRPTPLDVLKQQAFSRRMSTAAPRPSRLERLESRRLFAISLDGETLRLTGTAGNDQITLSRTGTDDVIARVNNESIVFDLDDIEEVFVRGEAGDDFIRPSASGLTARGIWVQTNGGPGNDRIEGGNNFDFIFGDGGNDTIFGNTGDDEIHGDDGDDRIEGGAGNDIIYGGDDGDTLTGGDGFDTLVGGGGADNFTGGGELIIAGPLLPGLTFDHDGNLVFRGTDQPDLATVVRGSGNSAGDLFVSINGQMQRFGGGAFAGFRFHGNGGDDVLRVGAQLGLPATLDGGAGNDQLVGGAAADRLLGGDGDDTLSGNGAADALLGQDGNDLVVGGTGNDFLDGGGGNDSLYGQNGNDTLLGQTANDNLFAHDGARDTVNGGSNSDTADVDGLDIVTGVETTT